MSQNKMVDKLKTLIETDKTVVREVRILNTTKGTVSGYFNCAESLFHFIKPYSNDYQIFMTLNPISISKIDSSRLNQALQKANSFVKDADIENLKYIFVDLDPKRSINMSSSESELSAAKEKARKIVLFLESHKFTRPIICLSGNGMHLLYPILLSNTPEHVKLLKTFLQILGQFFSDDKVEVDLTTYNPSRLTKVYGTYSRKGEPSSERPHRQSQILMHPTEEPEKNNEALLKFIQNYESILKPFKESTGFKSVEEFLNKHQLEIANVKSYYDVGTLYVLKTCPFNPEHTDRSAYVIQFHNGTILARCHHNSCQSNNWPILYKKYEKRKWEGKGSVVNQRDEKRSVADLLADIAHQDSEFALDSNRNPYSLFKKDNHIEIYRLSNPNYHKILRYKYYEEYKKTVPKEAIQQVIDLLEAKASFDGKEYPIELRVTKYGNSFYYNLCDSDWNVVEISDDGIQIIPQTVPLFTKNNVMKEQVLPDLNVDPLILKDLIKKHYRFTTEDDLILYTLYLVTCFIPNIARPLLLVHGEKGSAKSTLLRLTKSLVDPSAIELNSLSNKRDDLAINLSNHHLVAYDNLRTLSKEISDLLCVAVTGGSFTKRKLYSDEEETVLSFKRTILMNGIGLVANQPDLLDRSIIIELQRIPETEYQPEEIIYDNFENDKSKILGCIFQLVQSAKRIRPSIELKQVKRLADFTYWLASVAQAFGITQEQLFEILDRKEEAMMIEIVEANIVVSVLMKFMSNKCEYVGSVAELLRDLETFIYERNIRITNLKWPGSASVLSTRLSEAKSNLEYMGIYYYIKNAGSAKRITIYNENYKVE